MDWVLNPFLDSIILGHLPINKPEFTKLKTDEILKL